MMGQLAKSTLPLCFASSGNDDIELFTSKLRAGVSPIMEQEMWRLLLLMDRATVWPSASGPQVYLAILKMTGGRGGERRASLG